MAHDSPPAFDSGLFDVVIIGAGFSGSLLAVHLAAQSGPLRVALVERTHSFGPGLAYGAAAPEHLLNVPAGKMSAFPEEPEHFLNWIRRNPELAAAHGAVSAAPEMFLPRRLYGCYLASLVAEAAQKNDRLHLVSAEATDVERLPDGKLDVYLGKGKSLRARNVVLAWGNFPPGFPATGDGSRTFGGGFIENPWSAEARAALAQPGEVLIIGSGLTCLDLLATARKLGREKPLHVLSRHGLFPQPHHTTAPWPPFLDRNHLPASIRALFRLVRVEVQKASLREVNWRAVVDSLRPFTQDLWRGLPVAERRRFLRHVRSLWETLRHRAAPAMRAAKDELETRGLLLRHRGRLHHVEKTCAGLEVVFRLRGSEVLQRIKVQTVINASGPEPDPRRIESTLLRNMLARGLVGPDALGLGIEVAAPQSFQGDPLHTVGSLRKGALWESTAVPELRIQAAELAKSLHAICSAEGPASPAIGHSDPGHLWLFEI